MRDCGQRGAHHDGLATVRGSLDCGRAKGDQPAYPVVGPVWGCVSMRADCHGRKPVTHGGIVPSISRSLGVPA